MFKKFLKLLKVKDRIDIFINIFMLKRVSLFSKDLNLGWTEGTAGWQLNGVRGWGE